MATNSLGQGKCNVSLPMPTEARDLWGQLAFREDRSKASFIQRMALEGLRIRNPLAAANLERIWRQHRQRIAGLGCLLVLTIGIATGTDDFRRPTRGRRREDVQEVAA